MLNDISNYLKGVFLLTCLSSGIFASAMLTPAVVYMASFYVVGVNEFNLVITIYLAGYLIGQIISAILGKTYRAIQIFRLGVLVFIIGNLICIYSIHTTEFYYILLGRFISAIGLSSGLVCSIYLINTSFKREHSIIWLSLGVSSYAIAIIVSVVIGSYISEIFSWKNIFYILLFYGAALFISSFFVRFPTTAATNIPPQNLTAHKSSTINTSLLTYSLSMGFFTAIAYCYFEIGPSYAINTLGLNPISYAYWNLLGVSGILASSLIGKIYFMRKKNNTLLVCCLMNIVVVICFNIIKLYYGENPTIFFSLIFVLFLLGGVMYAIAASELGSIGNSNLYRTGVATFINLGSALLCLSILNAVNIFLIELFSLIIILFSVICASFIFVSKKLKT